MSKQEFKELRWIGDSLQALRKAPESVRKAMGVELMRVQGGLEPSDWKPMTQVGKGVREIRVHDKTEWRSIYITKIADCVFVLHSFEKKNQKTAKRDIELARKRLAELVEHHRERTRQGKKRSASVKGKR